MTRTNRTRTRSYAFRREDNGEIVWVDWPTMMEQVSGFITLPDGVEAKRCVHLEKAGPSCRPPEDQRAVPMPVISDAMSFSKKDLKNRRAQLRTWGLAGIEFKRDPLVPEFYQVHCASEKARDRYAKHRNLVNRTGSLGGGLMLTQEELDRAAEMVSR